MGTVDWVIPAFGLAIGIPASNLAVVIAGTHNKQLLLFVKTTFLQEGTE
jgi:hypothetical protein